MNSVKLWTVSLLMIMGCCTSLGQISVAPKTIDYQDSEIPAKWGTDNNNADPNPSTEMATTPFGIEDNITLITVPDSLATKASRLLQYQIGLGIQTFYLPVVIPIGLVGNFIAAMVLVKKGNREISCYTYMTALAVFDWFLMVLALYYWLVSNVLVYGWTELVCQLLVWLFHFLTTNSTWIVVLMTTDRYIAVVKPLKSSEWCRPSQARTLLVVLAVILGIFCIPQAFYTTVLPSGRSCAGLTTENGLFGLVYSWLSLFVNCLFPFTIVLTLNIVILINVKSTSKTLRKHIASSPNNQHTTLSGSDSSSGVTTLSVALGLPTQVPLAEGTVNETSLGNGSNLYHSESVQSINLKASVMGSSGSFINLEKINNGNRIAPQKRHYLNAILLLVSITMLVLTAPQYIRYIFYEFYDFKASPERYATYILMFHVTQKLYYTNSAVNFFLYCMAGSKFRNDLKEVLNCSKSG